MVGFIITVYDLVTDVIINQMPIRQLDRHHQTMITMQRTLFGDYIYYRVIVNSDQVMVTAYYDVAIEHANERFDIAYNRYIELLANFVKDVDTNDREPVEPVVKVITNAGINNRDAVTHYITIKY